MMLLLLVVSLVLLQLLLLKDRTNDVDALSDDHSEHHALSRRTSSSCSGVKSFSMLNSRRICSGDFPLIMSATLCIAEHKQVRVNIITMKNQLDKKKNSEYVTKANLRLAGQVEQRLDVKEIGC